MNADMHDKKWKNLIKGQLSQKINLNALIEILVLQLSIGITAVYAVLI